MSRLYKIVMSRKILGIFYLISGFILIWILAERVEMLSSEPSVWKRVFLFLGMCSPLLFGMYLVCTKNRYKTDDIRKNS